MLKPEYKILVCGGREYNDVDRVFRILEIACLSALSRDPNASLVIVHGAAKGADSLAANFVEYHQRSASPSFPNIQARAYPADWTTHGRRAGPIRNHQMLTMEKPDVIVAFPGGRGTAHMVSIGLKAGIPVYQVVK